MLDVSIGLDSLLCNREADFGSAEPYFWTLFFHVDTASIRQGPDVVRSTTPLQDFTTRSMYPSGVTPGDTVPIPDELGRYRVELEEGLGELPMFGYIGLLFDRRNTDANAISAAHRAFAEAGHIALNNLVPTILMYGPGQRLNQEIDDAVEFIKGAMIDAIVDALGWWDYADGQDRFIGESVNYFTGSQIRNAAANSQAIDVTDTIRLERIVPNSFSPSLPPATLVDDYTLNGGFGARSTEAPGPNIEIERDEFDAAVMAVEELQNGLATTRGSITELEGGARVSALAELEKQRSSLAPLLVKRAAAAAGMASRESLSSKEE